jgi:hypothetical protein
MEVPYFVKILRALFCKEKIAMVMGETLIKGQYEYLRGHEGSVVD